MILAITVYLWSLATKEEKEHEYNFGDVITFIFLLVSTYTAISTDVAIYRLLESLTIK